MFDPYYKWLGIRPEHQPPDHYRLLGLERFESDRDVIQAAGERQMAHVQSYKIGPQSELSQKILNEIARAKVCLLNPANKAEYDAALRAASAPVAPPPAAMFRPAAKSIVTADSIEIAESPRGSDSDTKLRRVQRKPNRKPQTLPLVVIAVCLALLIGAVASTFLFDFSGDSTRPQAAAPPQSVVTPPAASRRATPGEVGRSMESSTATNLPQPTRRPDRARSPSPPIGDPRHAIPSSAQIQEARSKFTIQGSLTPKVTLDAAIGATHPWTRYALLQMTIELALQADYASWPEAKRCAFEAARLLTAEFQVPNDFNSAVASQFRLRPSESSAKARDSSAGTRPAQVRPVPTTIATNPLAMNRDATKPAEITDVLTIDAPLIDLTKNQTEVKFKPLVKIESRTLILTGLNVIDNQLFRQYPESGRVELGRTIRLVLRDEPPRAGLEISLHGTDELYVRIKPMIQDPDDNYYPWTPSGIRDVRRRVERSVNAKREESQRSERLVELLSQQLSAATKTAAGIANRKSLQERLDIAKIEAADSRNKLQLLETFVASFRELEKLTDRIDRKARVSFRVVRDAPDGEATVVQTAP